MTPRCHCGRLVDGKRPKWSQWWRLTISDIEKTRSSCKTCAMVFRAAENLLGPAFVHYFHHFYFPARDNGDNGPLRVNLESYYYKISAHISALGIRPIETVQMQIYTSPGMLPATELQAFYLLSQVMGRLPNTLERHRSSKPHQPFRSVQILHQPGNDMAQVLHRPGRQTLEMCSGGPVGITSKGYRSGHLVV